MNPVAREKYAKQFPSIKRTYRRSSGERARSHIPPACSRILPCINLLYLFSREYEVALVFGAPQKLSSASSRLINFRCGYERLMDEIWTPGRIVRLMKTYGRVWRTILTSFAHTRASVLQRYVVYQSFRAYELKISKIHLYLFISRVILHIDTHTNAYNVEYRIVFRTLSMRKNSIWLVRFTDIFFFEVERKAFRVSLLCEMTFILLI